MRVMNRKGEMTIPIIIAVVIGIILLIFLLSGFTSQGRSFRDVIANLGSSGANVDTVMTGCEIACESGHYYAYCSQKRKVDYGDKSWEEGSCRTFEERITTPSGKLDLPDCDLDCNYCLNRNE